MKKIGLLLVILIYSKLAYSGELVYRDVTGGPNCSIATSESGATTIKTLTCSGKLIAKQMKTCSIRFGCSYQFEPVSAEHDFNFNIPGLDSEDKIFGSVSLKSAANVFTDRALSKNYLAYSADGILDKPIIFVEGYDPANDVFPDFYYYRGISNLVFGGRDLIIVNFSDGASNMEANAILLQSIIEEINAAKTGNHPLAVIGYSMGGIIARKTLKNMEDQFINHNTSLYVSYDSPHMGANSPPAIAHTVERLIDKLDSAVAGYTSSELKRARKVYNSEAAQQMLLDGRNFSAATAQEFPKNLTLIGITSGSLLGYNGMQVNSVSYNQHIAGFKFYLYYSSGGALLPSSSLSESFNWYTKSIGENYYDNVPGSYSNIFKESYLKLKEGSAKFESWLAPQDNNITFVPTYSSLAMNVSPTAPVIDSFKYDSPFDRYIAVNPVGGIDACLAFNSQIAVGENIPHNPGNSFFNSNQLEQLRCAMNQYHKPDSVIPNRFLKLGRNLSTTLLIVPINNLLLN